MIYQAKVLRVLAIDWYEGTIELEICGKRIYSIYWADSEFAERYLVEGSTIPIDLWMSFYHSKPEMVLNENPYCVAYPPSSKEYKICGRVVEIFSSHSFRLDCGVFLVDIRTDEEFNTEIGSYVGLLGSLQSYFSGTEYDWASISNQR